MCLHGISAIKIRTGARPTAYGLVILPARTAEGEIVHGPLGCCQHAECTVQCIHNALRCFDVARNDRGRVLRVEQAPLRDNDIKRFEASRVEWDIVIHERAEYVEYGRLANRSRRVEVVWLLV